MGHTVLFVVVLNAKTFLVATCFRERDGCTWRKSLVKRARCTLVVVHNGCNEHSDTTMNIIGGDDDEDLTTMTL